MRVSGLDTHPEESERQEETDIRNIGYINKYDNLRKDNMKDIAEENTHIEENKDIDDNMNNSNLSKYKSDDNMKY